MSVRGRIGRPLLLVGALMVLTSAPASPAGIELAWDQCYGQWGARSMRTSACAADTGSQSLIAAFRPLAGVNALEGVDVVIDFQVQGGAVSCWWNFAVGQLRNDQLTVLHTSPTDANGDPTILCDNHYFLDRGAAGGGWMIVTGADRGQLRGIAAIPAGTGLPVSPDAQQYGIGFRVANGSTVPAASCSGCLRGVCFILDSIKLTSAGSPDMVLSSPHPGSEDRATWQGTQGVLCPGVAIQNSTWGAIKSIYR